ncbi:TonB-dependent receptor plug domain-containing protein [SAR92 clade bacterium H246]
MKNLYGIVFGLIIVLPVYADESEEVELAGFYGEDDFVSIATGEVQPIAKAPAVASVITADQIKAMGIRDIDQALETVPGLHVGRDIIGYNPLYTFRGISADFNPQVLMLINGVAITNLFQGDRNVVWGGMPIEAISRIEIIRGPGSALYGADAFAGVINIVTKDPEEIGSGSAGVNVGSFDTVDFWLSNAGTYGDLSYGAVIELHKTDGADPVITSDAQSFLDLLTGTEASNAPAGVDLERDNIDLRVELAYKKLRLRGGLQIRDNFGDGAGAAQTLGPDNKFQSKRYNVDLTYSEEFFNNLAVDFQISHFDTSQEVIGDFVVYPAGSTGPFLDQFGAPIFGVFPDGVIGTPEIFENHTRVGFTAQYSGIEKHDISFGSGYYEGAIDKVTEEKNFGRNPATPLPILPGDPVVDVSDTPFVFLTEDERQNSYVYIQDVWQFSNDWQLTAGLRYDDYSDFGTTTNPRLALVWSTSYELTTKFLYGEAFRAPSFAQTRAINNPLILGNLELQPEQIKSYEVAFDYRPSYDLRLNLNFFYYDWTDIIQFVPDSSESIRTAQNVGVQTGKGLEFEARWSVSESLELTGNFAWQDSHDELANAPAANSPEKQVYFRSDWQIDNSWQMNVQASWVMDRNRTYDDFRAPVGDYVLVDMNIRNKLSEDVEVALIVNNLLDEDAFEPSPNAMPVPFIPNDLPLAGRSFIGEIRYKF